MKPCKKVRGKPTAAFREEIVRNIHAVIDRLLDGAFFDGLSESQARTAAEEAAVNWSRPKLRED